MDNKTSPNQPNQTSNQGNKPRTDDVPGTSRDPTGRVISDKSSQGKGRQDQGSQQRGGSDQRGSGYRPESEDQKGS